MNKIWTVEYSVKEGCYHVDTLDKVIKTNLSTLALGIHKDYILLGMFKTIEEADNFCGLHRNYNHFEVKTKIDEEVAMSLCNLN